MYKEESDSGESQASESEEEEEDQVAADQRPAPQQSSLGKRSRQQYQDPDDSDYWHEIMTTARRANRVTLEKIALETKLHQLLQGTVLRLAWEMPNDAEAEDKDGNGEKPDDSEAAGASDP